MVLLDSSLLWKRENVTDEVNFEVTRKVRWIKETRNGFVVINNKEKLLPITKASQNNKI